MEMKVLSLLFLRCRSVCSTISCGNFTYHQILSSKESPPQDCNELSQKREAVVILEIIKAIGVSKFIPESSCKACQVKLSSYCIVPLMMYMC